MIRRWLFPWPQVSVSEPLTDAQIGRLAFAATERHTLTVSR